MLTIRKQNFETQLCFSCNHNTNDPEYAIVYTLYHKLQDESKCLPCNVVIPRCRHCAMKMKPITSFKIAGAIIGGLGSFFATLSENSFWFAIICGLFFAIVAWFVIGYLLSFAFVIVYRQLPSDYKLISVMKNKYDWQENEPKRGERDITFTEEKMNRMLDDLVINYDCEYGSID